MASHCCEDKEAEAPSPLALHSSYTAFLLDPLSHKAPSCYRAFAYATPSACDAFSSPEPVHCSHPSYQVSRTASDPHCLGPLHLFYIGRITKCSGDCQVPVTMGLHSEDCFARPVSHCANFAKCTYSMVHLEAQSAWNA